MQRQGAQGILPVPWDCFDIACRAGGGWGGVGQLCSALSVCACMHSDRCTVQHSRTDAATGFAQGTGCLISYTQGAGYTQGALFYHIRRAAKYVVLFNLIPELNTLMKQAAFCNIDMMQSGNHLSHLVACKDNGLCAQHAQCDAHKSSCTPACLCICQEQQVLLAANSHAFIEARMLYVFGVQYKKKQRSGVPGCQLCRNTGCLQTD